MKNKKNITILKTAVGSLPSVSLINELKRNNMRVIGVDSDPNSIGFDFCDKSYLVPKVNPVLVTSAVL